MKKKQIATLQVISVFVICILVVLTVLYQKGYYDFTFIDRPSDRSSSETTKKNNLDLFTPTFQFDDTTQGGSSPKPNVTTTASGNQTTLPPDADVETGESTEKEEETLPPLDFETEPESTDAPPESTDTPPESADDTTTDSTDAPSDTTDSPEETTGEPDNTDSPESSDSPDSTTGPEGTTDAPQESETTGATEQTNGNETSGGTPDNNLTQNEK